MSYKIGIAVLVLLIIGAASYWFSIQKQDSQKPLSSTTNSRVNETQTDSVEMAAPSPSPDPTKDWKVYTNTKYEYTLKYPNTVSLYEDNTYYHYLEFKRTNAASGEFPVFYGAAIKATYVARSPASVNYMSSDVINNLYSLKIGESKNIDTSTFTRVADRQIGGESALALKVSATGINQQRYFVKHSGNIYMFVSDNPTEEFQNFLNSIKFTD